MKPLSWIEKVNCAIEGILWSVRTQRHMRIHFLAALGVLFAALFFQLTNLEFLLLVLAAIFVLFAELFNTAIEVVVDMVSPEYSEHARRAKDVAAGAVLLASIGAVVLGYLVLSGDAMRLFGESARLSGKPPGGTAVVAVLIVVILVVLLKALLNRGTPLHGGMPSGHSAVSFSVATSISLSDVHPAISLMALALAVMVAHSRLIMQIHTMREVIAGSLLGAAVTMFIVLIFR
jgi:diacylglycerol kinase (ATP)